jgi:uncharacterized protein (DUF433 family)
MEHEKLLQRISIGSGVCGGLPCIEGTRIEVAVVLDALAEGLTPSEVVDHFPSLTMDDVRAAIAYASDLARESVWRVGVH